MKDALRCSFRDPDGAVIQHCAGIFRIIRPHATTAFREFLSNSWTCAQMRQGCLCRTHEVHTPPEGLEVCEGAFLVEHEPIPFANYPFEWIPAMLQSAGQLTLRLAGEARTHGYTMKDATPFNVMFDEYSRPVFLDLLSFAECDPLQYTWQPYGQFLRTFAYPLMAARAFGLGLDQVFLPYRDGIEAEQLRRMASPSRLLQPPFLNAVWLPTVLGDRASPGLYQPRRARSADEAEFILRRVFGQAERLIRWREDRHEPRGEGWSTYMQGGHRYDQTEFEAKEKAVVAALQRVRPAQVLDVGANTGHFSVMAARAGASVVAIDRDVDALAVLFERARREGLRILPLHIDLARSPAGTGWNNEETKPFLERAEKRFDCVLALAVLHHVLVNERVPLGRLLDLFARLTTGWLVIEYVDPSDEQFVRIARGREALHADLTRAAFEQAAGRRFTVEAAVPLTPSRVLYILRRRAIAD